MLKRREKRKAVIIAAASVAALAVVGFGCYGIKALLHQPEEEPEVVADVVEIPEDEAATAAIDVPEFKKVVITSESVEKDLTLFISDTEDTNIVGTKFSVKLIDPENKESIEPYIKAITDINDQIEANGSGEKKADVTSVKIVNDDGTVDSSEIKATAEEQLYIDKAVALEAYSIALEQVAGKVLTDDDADGVITESEMDPGDYLACLMYSGDGNVAYDPEDYAASVNVKDKLETKIVVNIKKKIQKDDASEDGQKKAAAEVEAQLADTVAFVESSDKIVSKVESTDKVKVSGATTTLTANKVSGDETATSSHSFTKTYCTITTVIKLLDENDEVSDTSTKEDKVVVGSSYTIKAPSVSGYVLYEADYPDDTKLTIDGPTTITFTYKKAATTAFSSGVRYSKYAAAASDENISGKASLSSSFSDGKFTINLSTEGDAKASSLNVNGSEISLGKSPYSYTVTKEGTYKISVTISYSDGASDTIYNEWSVSGTSADTSKELTDESGNVLYVDKECTQKATVADYEKGTKTFYYKVENHKYTGFQCINGVTYYFDADGNKVTGTQVISGVTYNFGSDGGLMVSGTGIDVSKYQGDINWGSAKTAISYAIIRCGYRGMKDGLLHEDPYFYKNMKNAKANGVSVGVYIYSTALTEAEAVEEASMAVTMAKSAGGCSYPIYIDMEDSTRGVNKLSNEQRTAIINAFCATVQSAGIKSGVYANKTWLTEKINTSNLSGNIQVWVAQYNTTCTYKGRYTMWQYSSKGSIPGIKGNVDVNKSYF